jgi:hypothetical protein
MQVHEVHIDQALSDFAVGYALDTTGFIADMVAPPVNVQKMSDHYWVGGKESFKLYNTRRAPTATFPRIELGVSSDTYLCEGYGVEVPVSREEVANADASINPEQEATALGVDAMKLAYELRVASAFFNASNFSNGVALTGDDRWNKAASDPIADIQAAKDAVATALGKEPNTLIIGKAVWTALRQHPDLVERIKYVQIGSPLNEQLLAQLLDIDRVIVGRSIYDSTVEGDSAGFTGTHIWGKYAAVAYMDGNVSAFSRKNTCPMRTFVWAGSPSSGRFGVETYYEPQIKSDVVQVTDYVDEKVIDNDTVYLYSTVVD